MTISRSVYNQLFEQAPPGTTSHQEKVIRLRPTEAKAGAVVMSSKNKIQMWTKEEHERFLVALEMFPSGPWKKVADFIGTKTPRQTMTHAQKYRQKIHRRQRGLRNQKKPTSAPNSPAPLDTAGAAANVKFEPKPMASPYGVADFQVKQEAALAQQQQQGNDPANSRLLDILAQQATTMQQTPPTQQLGVQSSVLVHASSPDAAAAAANQVSPGSQLPSLAEILHLKGSNAASTDASSGSPNASTNASPVKPTQTQTQPQPQPRAVTCQCNCRCGAHGNQQSAMVETSARPRPQQS